MQNKTSCDFDEHIKKVDRLIKTVAELSHEPCPTVRAQFRSLIYKVILLFEQKIEFIPEALTLEIINIAKQIDPELGAFATEKLFEPAMQMIDACQKVGETGLLCKLSGTFNALKCVVKHGPREVLHSCNKYKREITRRRERVERSL